MGRETRHELTPRAREIDIGQACELPRQLVGLSKAMEFTLTGDLVDAEEALRIGLVSRVVPQDQLLDEARAMARKLASGPPLAQRAIERAMHKGFQMDWKSLGEYQQALGDVLWRTDD